MTASMTKCKQNLAALWFIGAGILFFFLLVQSILGRYGEKNSEAWSWLLPTIMPTLSLVIGVLVIDALGKGTSQLRADRFLFRLTCGLSAAYLLAVLLVFLLQPFAAASPIDVMNQANLWLGPFQGLVAAAMGAFFVKVPSKDADAAESQKAVGSQA